MDASEIRHYFALDKTLPEPLVNQLSRRIGKFIAQSAPGTQLPAERVMAEELGISRVTVRNALAPFIHEGKILQQRRNGTVVAPGKPHQAGPLALGLPWNVKPPRRKLRFLSYETLPEQLNFWRDAVESFNKQQSRTTVELLPVADLPQDTAPLRELVEQKQIDLLLYSPMFDQNYTEIVQKLPEDLQKIHTSADFIPQIITGREKICQYLLPVSFEFCHTLWNVELAEKLGLKNVAQRLKNGEKIRMISEIGEKLPPDVWAGSHIWCQLAYHGVHPFPEERENLVEMLKKLAGVSHIKRAYFTTQTSPLDDVEKFVNRQLLFLDASFTQLQWVGIPTFPFKLVPCHQVRDGKLIMSSVDIGITNRCPDPESATEFCRFLLSPEIQKSVETKKMVQPVRMEQYLEAMAAQNHYSRQESLALLQNGHFFRDMNHKLELAQYFLIFEIRQELADLFHNILTPEETAGKILEKWQKFTAGRLLL